MEKTVDFHVAWSRWYRRVVEKSVAQIRGLNVSLSILLSEFFLTRNARNAFQLNCRLLTGVEFTASLSLLV
jgi:hypothetical protein